MFTTLLTIVLALSFLNAPVQDLAPGAHVGIGTKSEQQASVTSWKIQPAVDAYDSSVRIKKPVCCQQTDGYGKLQNQKISE